MRAPTWRLQDLKSGVQSPLGARVWSDPSCAVALEQAQNCKHKSDKRKENKKMSGDGCVGGIGEMEGVWLGGRERMGKGEGGGVTKLVLISYIINTFGVFYPL